MDFRTFLPVIFILTIAAIGGCVYIYIRMCIYNDILYHLVFIFCIPGIQGKRDEMKLLTKDGDIKVQVE